MVLNLVKKMKKTIEKIIFLKKIKKMFLHLINKCKNLKKTLIKFKKKRYFSKNIKIGFTFG